LSVTDLTRVTPTLDSRSISFENPTGAPGAGGTALGGRKGAPAHMLEPGERVVVADIEGPGVVRHIWMTFPPAAPEVMRAKFIEVFYNGADEPSVSVPVMDLCGVPWGRPVHLDSALGVISQGRGFNTYVPMPFTDRIRIEFVNASTQPGELFVQVDYTLEDLADGTGYLHATFRRENPTVLKQDFVIFDGLRGPGRFIGSVVGIRVLDGGFWYGEGEVKMYIDGDDELPTICGTGLEDYVGSAWGMGTHLGPYAAVPLDRRAPGTTPMSIPDFVTFYRWHVPDPIVFAEALRVTIQQIGMTVFLVGQEEQMEQYLATNPPAGRGWERDPRPGVIGMGICERVDDYSAAAFVYCRDVQPVPRVDVAAATADLIRRDYEPADPMEAFFA